MRKRLFFVIMAVGMLTAGHVFAESVREIYEEGLRELQEGNAGVAIDAFEKAVELRPDVPQIYYALGLAYMQREGSPYDALDAFEEAVRLDPGLADAYYNLAVIHSGLTEDHRLAEEYYEKAIKANSDFSAAYFGMGWLQLLKFKLPEAALPYLKKAVELSPHHPESNYFLGVVYVLTGESHKALKPISTLRLAGANEMSLALEAMLEEDPAAVSQRLLGEG